MFSGTAPHRPPSPTTPCVLDFPNKAGLYRSPDDEHLEPPLLLHASKSASWPRPFFLLSWRLVASPADPPPQSPVCSACSVGLFSSRSRRHDARLVGFGPKRGHRVPTFLLANVPSRPSRDLDALHDSWLAHVELSRLSSCYSSPFGTSRRMCRGSLVTPQATGLHPLRSGQGTGIARPGRAARDPSATRASTASLAGFDSCLLCCCRDQRS